MMKRILLFVLLGFVCNKSQGQSNWYELNQNSNEINPQLFEREMIVNEEVSYRLDNSLVVSFSSNGIHSRLDTYYDENGKIPLRIYYIWDSESQSFVPYDKYEYTYDENGNQTQQIHYYWNSESQSFVPDWRGENTHDENGNRNLEIYYLWDTESQSLVPNRKSEYTYDENGNRTLYIVYRWDTESQSFVPDYKYEHSFNEDNFKTNETVYNWYSQLGIFKPSFKMDISTFSETQTELVREGILYEYDTNFNTWNELEEELKSYWYYTKNSSLSTNSVELNSLSIYPNPTKGNLNINSSESLTNPIIELYDVKGSKIISNPFNFSEPIDVSGLQPSIYIYLIKDGNEVKQSGKVIKE